MVILSLRNAFRVARVITEEGEDIGRTGLVISYLFIYCYMRSGNQSREPRTAVSLSEN